MFLKPCTFQNLLLRPNTGLSVKLYEPTIVCRRQVRVRVEIPMSSSRAAGIPVIPGGIQEHLDKHDACAPSHEVSTDRFGTNITPLLTAFQPHMEGMA